MRIRKRTTTPVRGTDDPLPLITPPKHIPKRAISQHVEVFRVPDEGFAKTFANGPTALTMHHVASLVTTEAGTRDSLFEDLLRHAKDNWFITKNPGRYAAMGFAFDQSFTFYVDKDGAYHAGWDQWVRDRAADAIRRGRGESGT